MKDLVLTQKQLDELIGFVSKIPYEYANPIIEFFKRAISEQQKQEAVKDKEPAKEDKES